MAKPPAQPAPENTPPPDPPKKKGKGGRPSRFREKILKAPPPPKKPKRSVAQNPAVENVDVPGQPAEPQLALNPEAFLEEGSQHDIIDSLFSKAFERYAKKDEANRGVEAIAEVVAAIQSGRSLKELETKLVPLLSEQASKSTLLQAVMYNHQMERIALYFDARWRLERGLWEDLREQKLSPREKIALLSLALKEADKASDYVNKLNTSFQPMSDVEPTIEKAGKHSASKVMAEKKKEFEGTTPQGREIIRRLTFKAKQASAKLVDEELKQKENEDGGKQP